MIKYSILYQTSSEFRCELLIMYRLILKSVFVKRQTANARQLLVEKA